MLSLLFWFVNAEQYSIMGRLNYYINKHIIYFCGNIRGKIDNLRINCDISVIDMKRNGYSDKERYRMG